MSREKFAEVVNESLRSLSEDLKALMRLVEDGDLDDESRIEAAGALIHVLSAANAIPGVRGLLAYVDDALVLRLVLERAEKRSPDALAKHRDESSTLLDAWPEHLAATRAFLGADLVAVLERATDGVIRLAYEGHAAPDCVRDSTSMNWLYDAIHEKILKLDFDDDEISRAAKQVDQLIPPLRGRANAKVT